MTCLSWLPCSMDTIWLVDVLCPDVPWLASFNFVVRAMYYLMFLGRFVGPRYLLSWLRFELGCSHVLAQATLRCSCSVTKAQHLEGVGHYWTEATRYLSENQERVAMPSSLCHATSTRGRGAAGKHPSIGVEMEHGAGRQTSRLQMYIIHRIKCLEQRPCSPASCPPLPVRGPCRRY